MKKIEAIVEPLEVEGVKEGLTGIGVGPLPSRKSGRSGPPEAARWSTEG